MLRGKVLSRVNSTTSFEDSLLKETYISQVSKGGGRRGGKASNMPGRFSAPWHALVSLQKLRIKCIMSDAITIST